MLHIHHLHMIFLAEVEVSGEDYSALARRRRSPRIDSDGRFRWDTQMRTMVLEYESQHLPEQNHPVM